MGREIAIAISKGEQIIAAPTLVRTLRDPLRKFIGSMADKEKLIVGLERPKGTLRTGRRLTPPCGGVRLFVRLIEASKVEL